jgi:uncharacterized membrane protein
VIVLFFFVIGLADGNVNERNMLLWMGIPAVCAISLFGGPWLRHHHYPTLGLVITAIVAIPSILFGIFMLIAVLSGSKNGTYLKRKEQSLRFSSMALQFL